GDHRALDFSAPFLLIFCFCLRCRRGGGNLATRKGFSRGELISFIVTAIVGFAQRANVIERWQWHLRWLRGQMSLDEALAIARRGRVFTGNHSSDLHECEQDGCDGRDLSGAQSHKIDNQLCETATLRNSTAKTGQHPLFESRIGFFMSE